MNKSFRGKIADGEQQEIRLSTNNGLTGYQIKKLQLLPYTPGHTKNLEIAFQVFSTERTGSIPTSGATIDFDDPTLLAAGFYVSDTSHANSSSLDIIFDNVKINQDIFITMTDNEGADSFVNYYIELEQMQLSKDEATMATLKDMRAGPDTNFGP
jgi:hypothetical protein